ncbi:hypothetical protein LG275_05265 [Chryseomicrobium palamuruense]
MKRIPLLVVAVLLLSIPTPAFASLQQESIYDLLVDRYFNQTSNNDIDVNTQDPQAFAGGDFLGIRNRLAHIQDMGFTYISIGPIFETEKYDGSEISSYSSIESRYGTEEEFVDLLDELHAKDMKLMIDLPIGDATPENLQEMQAFVERFPIDGVKLTNIPATITPEVEQFVAAINTDERDVISLEETDLELDANYSSDTTTAFQQAFKTVDQPMSGLINFTESDILTLDTLVTERFTYFSTEENMFPPTRIMVAMGALLTLPGVPVMTYGTEIAMNGDSQESSHQIMNFRVDEDIMLFIEDLQTIRNQSEALQRGDFELLQEEDGYLVFKRSTENEAFIVVINNTSGTKTFAASEEIVGVDKELRGLFGRDVVRQADNGEYRLTIDRELVELYHVKENSGLNTAYIIAMAIAYALFLGFIYLVWRKGKQKRAQQN